MCRRSASSAIQFLQQARPVAVPVPDVRDHGINVISLPRLRGKAAQLHMAAGSTLIVADVGHLEVRFHPALQHRDDGGRV
ncbi:MAG: hypothetical protein M3021_02170 [Actinomycetota bacterium]|uniref:hypothetical protein n=1 Tax=Paenarthrobacter sp. PH39-S1 TaxID=3046204 RepID=UPI0024BA2AB4|nr:hypothetical protein [Paenarthrobacter sp. PH39-S1]MDJ0356268.1 hypothetical protein [Paenarthrobacter sp. PH39-S1]MDQ6739193.1 hypothetical protein [Actinomycetota bacterium]